MQPSWIYSAIASAEAEARILQKGEPYAFLSSPEDGRRIVTKGYPLNISLDWLELGDRPQIGLTSENREGGTRRFCITDRVQYGSRL